MYQFYYADGTKVENKPQYKRSLTEEYDISAIRPTMWEEHCLECSAPLCFENCPHFQARNDGRCKRFANGIYVSQSERGCSGQSARVTFRRWANMMTIIYPAMLPVQDYQKMVARNQKLGNLLGWLVKCHLPVGPRWQMIRTIEFIRRRQLKKLSGLDNTPDAFVFHGYSFSKEDFRLIMEIYEGDSPVFKTSMIMQPGENLVILDRSQLEAACWTSNSLVKIYPENNLEVELDILWCDFVQGKSKTVTKPAPQVKCVVWDLDNTVWNGTLIETEQPETLCLKEHVLSTIQWLDERGIIQSIASKNDFEFAWPVVERLGLSEFFLYPQIHWNAKSGSMEDIAKSLNIGIDSLALIDDSVFEREQVKSVWSQVRTYDVTELDSLLEKKEFDVMVTEESKNRRTMYKAEEQRNQLKASDGSGTIEFLKKCNLCIELFAPNTKEEMMRCYELVVRTNQLNMSGMKYSEQEFDAVLKREKHQNIAFSCKDDFGSYGIVGFAQYRVQEEQLIFTEFAMSCRVAGKYVESALFSTLLTKEQCKVGRFEVRKTKKNTLLRRTLEEIGFATEEESNGKIRYSFQQELKEKSLVQTTERK